MSNGISLPWIAIPVAAICLLSLLAAPASAQVNVEIGELSYLDRQYMSQQRSNLEDITRRHFGTGFNGEKAHDLELLQRILDRGLVRSTQTAELQAMGMVLGDLLADELDMHWVVYEDRQGRSRALRYRDTDNYLFPVTMISRRREAGNETSVEDIYQKAYDEIAPVRERLPFQ
ncbi:DUF3806 domain-containing protein [Kineobactrum salinum]|uniref:DUF3806 domain-containing protein n=1 Tax=Kineobactrum salinum TaxID=2708301 RepID=A0A6C0UA75_9GAMM|nr:DUF3806 domain-containing protein [Kineobactrum salinum]QIB66674.1 DUF3806 domain-containing protein [Kineobactrum salinum]